MKTQCLKHTYRSVSLHHQSICLSELKDRLLQHARREAQAIAWENPFPDLVLPLLMEEKSRKAIQYAEKQFNLWNHQTTYVLAS